VAALALMCTAFAATAWGQAADTAKPRTGALGAFERGIRSAPADTAASDSCESPPASNLFSELVGGFFKVLFSTAGQIYLELPHPNYGAHPYEQHGVYGVFEPDTIGSTPFYVQPGGGYTFTQPNVRTCAAEVRVARNSFVAGAAWQHNREPSESGTATLDLLCLTAGLAKAFSGYAVWQNDFGYRYIKGGQGYHGLRLGTELRVYTGAKAVVTASYHINAAGHAGFHETEAHLSYFIDNIELKAGYQLLKTFSGARLQGPSLGTTVWLAL
jgi:hypothetical protein